jgi:hypothetical protein
MWAALGARIPAPAAETAPAPLLIADKPSKTLAKLSEEAQRARDSATVADAARIVAEQNNRELAAEVARLRLREEEFTTSNTQFATVLERTRKNVDVLQNEVRALRVAALPLPSGALVLAQSALRRCMVQMRSMQIGTKQI